MSTEIPDRLLCSTDFPVGNLRVEEHTAELSEKEVQYAAEMILAQAAGSLVLFDQISEESYPIHQFLAAFFRKTPMEKLKSAEKDSPLFYLIEYAATFYYNTGNYMGFGDLKIIPRTTKEQLRELVKGDQELETLLSKCIDQIYDISDGREILGFHPNGYTTYYRPNDFTKEEAEGVDAVLSANKIRNENTIIIRHDDRYEVSVASIEVDATGKEVGEYNGKKVVVTKGRNSEALKKVVEHLKKAIPFAANDTQVKMLESLIEHYTTGSVEAHVKYSEHWVHDIDPVIETHQGFIECYRDPKGCRCEFEGLVSCVDKKESEILHDFVAASSKVLPLLPYPSEYERSTFAPPSYNALNIIAMTSSGYPIGINIPNYDEIRLKIGFKNVSLTNVMAASKFSSSITEILHPSMRDVFMEFSEAIESLATAAHELYGHGSVKLLKKEDVEGKLVPDLLSPGKYVKTYWPDDGTSYDSMFGSISSAFEECRAETTAVYLTFFDEVLDIFKVPQDKEYRKKFLYVTIIKMLIGGLRSMWCYSAESRKWTQAHSAARFAILRACIMWGRGAASVKFNKEGNVELYVDYNNLDGIKDAITTLLKHLTYYKATCLPGPGTEFFTALTSIDDFWYSVKTKVDAIPRKRAVYCGGVVREVDGKLKIQDVTKGEATPLDAVYYVLDNLELALK